MKKVLISWHMHSFGVAFLINGGLTLCKNNNLNNDYDQYKLFKEWKNNNKDLEIKCLYSKQKLNREHTSISFGAKLDEFSSLSYEKKQENCLKYTLNTQLDFLKNEYNGIFKTYEFNNDTDSEDQVTKFISDFVEKEITEDDTEYYINLYNSPTYVQIAWYKLTYHASFPKNIKITFIHIKKSTNIKDTPLPKLIVEKITKNPFTCENIINDIGVNYFKDINEQHIEELNYYLNKNDHFSILICGAPGTGKSRLFNEIEKEKEKDNNRNKNNLSILKLESADFLYSNQNTSLELWFKENVTDSCNILFVENIDLLPKNMQNQLLRYLETDSNGCFINMPSNSISQNISFQVIFTTNIPLFELRTDKLINGMFERISQRIIELPSLNKKRESESIIEDFISIYNDMNFLPPHKLTKDDKKIIEKNLQKIDLPGNYRTLQNIAITVHDYKNSEIFRTKYEKNDLNEYITNKNQIKNRKLELSIIIDEELTSKEYEKKFHKEFITTLLTTYTPKQIKEIFNVSEATYLRWKKGE